MKKKRAEFSNFFGFVLVSAGSSIGLGNIWRFPYLTGVSGGGIFVLIYAITMFTIGVSILLVEFIIGRHGRANAVKSYEKFNSKFKYLGYLNVFTSFIILSFYSVVGGFTIYYFINSLTGNIVNTDINYSEFFNNFVTDPYSIIFCTFLFLFFTIFIVIQGINKGIERYSRIMMSIMFILIIILMFRSLTLENAIEGIKWYLKPNFSMINKTTILAALGQVFFTLSVGLSTMLTYSSYLSKKEYLPKAAAMVAFLDFFISIISGFIIFPAVFSFGLNPASGVNLVFITLPEVFSAMPVGIIFSILFFLFLTFASITSSISMMEVAITYFTETFNINRRRISLFYGLAVFLLSIPAALSFNVLGELKVLGLNIFDLFEYFCANISLPLGGLMCAILVGWFSNKKQIYNLYSNEGVYKADLFIFWYNLVKYVVPPIIILIWINSIFI
ncbi:MAG: sodium-dependent transporter [Deferribacterota bacterium]|nr:sodium-dependent transporter [Deferribacterota bacterium]